MTKIQKFQAMDVRLQHVSLAREEIARGIGVSRSYYWMVVTGKRPCSDELLGRLREFYKDRVVELWEKVCGWRKEIENGEME